MNFKKFISGISALTIAASVFAGMAVTASAATTEKYSNNFEEANDFSYNGTSDATRFYYGADDAANDNLGSTANKVIGVTKGEYAYKSLPNRYTADTYMSFDLKLDASASKSVNSITLSDSLTATGGANRGDAKLTSNNPILTIGLTGTGNGQCAGSDNITVTTATDAAFTARLRGTGYRFAYSQLDQNNRDTSGWMHVEATFDFSEKTVDLNITRPSGNVLYSATNLAFADADATGLQGIALRSAGNYGGTYIDNIIVKDVPVASSIAISGDDTVTSGNSADYTATVLDQYGDELEDAVATLSASEADGVSYADGTLSVSSDIASDTEVTLTAEYGEISNTKTVTASALKGYTLKTTPYAGISIDGAAAVSTGAAGTYVFDIDDSEEHTVTISKTGYVSKENVSITPVKNGSQDLTLTAESGVTYYEDFSYVNDSFGLSGSVANGVFNVALGASATKTFDSPLNVDQKLITIETIGATANREGVLNLEGTGTYLRYFTGGSIRVYGKSNTSIDLGDLSDGYHKIQLFTTSKTQAASLFVDGVKKSGTLYTSYGADWTGLTTGSYSYTRSTSIDSISVTDVAVNSDGKSPITYQVKIGDADAVTYLPGTTVTIPAAEEGYEWQDAEGNVVEAGDVVVNSALTLTAVSTAVAPTGTATFVNDYNELEDGANGASVWAVVVTPGTSDVNKIGLKLNGNAESWANLNTSVSGSGSFTFAAVINKIQSEVSALDVIFE